MNYPPKPFTEVNETDLYHLMAQYPLATILSADPNTALNNTCQIPMLFDETCSHFICHVTANNPLTLQVSKSVKLLFNGPNAYLSPNHCNNETLPSWLYATVEVEGILELITEPQAQLAAMNTLTDHFERGFDTPWQVADLDDQLVNAMFKHIRFLRIKPLQCTGVFKLSQNKPSHIRQQVIKSLMTEGQDSVAELMRTHSKQR
ncbi:FMN-binding negative transcriptional regulator [Pseudoalteromonas sp. MMG012]|uniref:FMN-binding negative transcriptional regulator n=1 Tax=Pseudoalteromonas sp. MMG012 TaxID=2822686 RepID=UPI001B39FCA8|nr:FMN-binding negative transcriptional regulator [Pseudoalteromonas sp. MMG012]MBQ4850443.1 FMN-binding negative transcriptional regulator [Pseudoalteromonas sp. MMG012]